MWTVEQWILLFGAVGVVITALAGMTKAIADVIAATRKRDPSPPPQLGIIPATTTADDIDYRAYQDMKDERDFWRARALRNAEHIDEDTHPIDPKEKP